jgi:hypothetical protein
MITLDHRTIPNGWSFFVYQGLPKAVNTPLLNAKYFQLSVVFLPCLSNDGHCGWDGCQSITHPVFLLRSASKNPRMTRIPSPPYRTPKKSFQPCAVSQHRRRGGGGGGEGQQRRVVAPCRARLFKCSCAMHCIHLEASLAGRSILQLRSACRR